MAPKLDHIVLLVPHSVLKALPSWLTSALTVIPGGKHAGGVTENQLVLLQDGVYLEIIAFVGGHGSDEEDKRKRLSHRWDRQPEGHFIDWAISLDRPTQRENDEEFTRIQSQVEKAAVGLTYQDLVDGGRTTPDGIILKWATASPVSESGETVTGRLPFWCIDRTDRKLRVPYATRPALAQHPSGAVGVAGVTLHVADLTVVDQLRKVYNVLFAQAEKDEWSIEAPVPGRPSKLKVAVLDKSTIEQDITSWIELALYTTGPTQTISGQIVDGWRIDIRLEHVEA